MAFEEDKACMIAKVKAISCPDADIVSDSINSYADIVDAYYNNSDFLDCNPGYTTGLFQCAQDADLLAEGIYFAKSPNEENPELIINDPSLVHDCTASQVVISEEVNELSISGSSVIGRISISAPVSILTVGGGARVDLIEILDGGSLKYLRVRACRGNNSYVGFLKSPATIANVRVDDGGYYGGTQCEIPVGNCASVVTNVLVDRITSNSMRLGWEAPVDSIYVKVRYRVSGAGSWIDLAPDKIPGEFERVGNMSFFTFRSLRNDTFYDFELYNACVNGQLSAPVTKTQKTGTVTSSGGGGGATKPIIFTVGETDLVAPGDIQITLNQMEGMDIVVEVNGMSILTEGRDYTRSADEKTIYLSVNQDGFQRRFEEGETWRIELYQK